MKIIRLEIFNKRYNRLDNSIKILVEKQIEILIKTKGKGKHLFKNKLYERKVNNLRILYILEQDLEIIIILISITNKKNQQKDIELIKIMFEKYF